MPAPESRLALANATAIRGGRLLVIGFDVDVARAFDGATVFHQSLHAARACGDVADVRFGAWFDEPGYDGALVQMPKETERLRMLLVMARGALADGGQLVLIGRNDTGVRSAGRHIDELVGATDVLDYRFHCRALIATATVPAVASSLDAWESVEPVDAAGQRIELHSFPGVFSHARLDDGTASLLDALTIGPGARVLDVGCGSGVIGAWLRGKGVVCDSVDDDAVAVEAAARTVGDRARAWASDVYSDVTETYDVIVSNPPFHAGVRTSSETATAIIEQAGAHLVPGGELWLVANRFLDYLGPMRAALGWAEIVSEDRRYRVLRARMT